MLDLALEEDATLQAYVDSFATKEDLVSVSFCLNNEALY